MVWCNVTSMAWCDFNMSEFCGRPTRLCVSFLVFSSRLMWFSTSCLSERNVLRYSIEHGSLIEIASPDTTSHISKSYHSFTPKQVALSPKSLSNYVIIIAESIPIHEKKHIQCWGLPQCSWTPCCDWAAFRIIGHPPAQSWGPTLHNWPVWHLRILQAQTTYP